MGDVASAVGANLRASSHAYTSVQSWAPHSFQSCQVLLIFELPDPGPWKPSTHFSRAVGFTTFPDLFSSFLPWFLHGFSIF